MKGKRPKTSRSNAIKFQRRRRNTPSVDMCECEPLVSSPRVPVFCLIYYLSEEKIDAETVAFTKNGPRTERGLDGAVLCATRLALFSPAHVRTIKGNNPRRHEIKRR